MNTSIPSPAASVLATLLSNSPCHSQVQSRQLEPEMLFLIASTICITLCVFTIFSQWMSPKQTPNTCDTCTCKEDSDCTSSSDSRRVSFASVTSESDASSDTSSTDTSMDASMFQEGYSVSQEVSETIADVVDEKSGAKKSILKKQIRVSAITRRVVDASKQITSKTTTRLTATFSFKRGEKKVRHTTL